MTHRDCDPCSRPCTIEAGPDTCDQLWPWLAILKECVCKSLESSKAGAVCRCFVTGSPPPWDNCCQGQAWIRTSQIYPSKSFPTPDGGRFRCDHHVMAAVLEIGVLRCAPTFDDDGNPPTPEMMEEAFHIIQSDRNRLMRALRCCFQEESQCEVLNIGVWSPVQTQGGCMGGTLQVTISFNDADCCADDDFGHERGADGTCRSTV